MIGFIRGLQSIRLGGAERKLEPAMAGTCQLHTENHTPVLATDPPNTQFTECLDITPQCMFRFLALNHINTVEHLITWTNESCFC